MKKFTTTINCMDGRTQLPVINYLKEQYNCQYIDSVTEAGPVKILADSSDSNLVNSIKKRVKISVNKHGSKLIAIVAHHDCAGNPVDKETQLNQLKDAIKTVNSWGYTVEVIALWVDENWQVVKQTN